jgi:hypothetical protein
VRRLGTRAEAAPAGWSLHRTGIRPDMRVGFIFSLYAGTHVCLSGILYAKISRRIKKRRAPSRSRLASATTPVRQRDNVDNAEAPSRRGQCTSATTPRRQRDDTEEPARQCRGASVAISRCHCHGVTGCSCLSRLSSAPRNCNVYQRAQKTPTTRSPEQP